MPLALRTLLYDWRRFLPAVVAVAFSGLLVLMQAAIILGIFSLSSLYVTRSHADLWIGFPGVQSVDLGQPIPAEQLVWRDADNVTHAFADLATYKAWLQGFAIALGARGTMAFAWSWQKKAQLESLSSFEDIVAFDPISCPPAMS